MVSGMSFFMSPHAGRARFSRCEIAIALSILGVAVSGILPYMQSSMKSKDIEVPVERMDDIEAATVAFRLANKRIP